MADRYGPRLLTTLGLIIVGCCLLVISATNNNSLLQFIIPYVIARSISNPFLIGVVPRVATVNFFRRWRKLPLPYRAWPGRWAAAINIQIISLIALNQSWRAAYGYVGVFLLLLALPVFLTMRGRRRKSGCCPTARATRLGRAPVAVGVGPPRAWNPNSAGPPGRAMRTRAYWCIAGTAVFAIIASAGSGYILVPYLVSQSGPGLSNPQAVGVGSLGAVLAMTTLVWGIYGRQAGPPVLYGNHHHRGRWRRGFFSLPASTPC